MYLYLFIYFFCIKKKVAASHHLPKKRDAFKSIQIFFFKGTFAVSHTMMHLPMSKTSTTA